MTTAVAFLWHMHQPYYKDNLTGIYYMPWVRLHAIKAYYDMVAILEDYPKIKQNINLVPSLIMQLKDYASKNFKDIFWDLSVKPSRDLTDDDKKFILWNFFMANWDTMIGPNPRYWELLHKRGTKITEEDIDKALKLFTEKDYLDLQVWFNLAWFGFMARKNFPQIKEMFEKGKNFTESDKKVVLDTQIELINKILPMYKKAQENGQIEITTTPCFHPIMPLVYNTDFAKRCMPWVQLPKKFSAPEDVQSHLECSVNIYKEAFGVRPRGLWPSEGSVCPEIISIIAKQGFRWLATDEEILFNTIEVADKGMALYKPYKFCFDSSCMSLVFRDKGLSNAISFMYQKQDPSASAHDFVVNLNNIDMYVAKGMEPLVTVVLDGENPWEYYPNSGEYFLRNLFQKLSDSSNLYTTTVSDYIAKHPPTDQLRDLYSGSWINHNFDIWIGDLEENTAWNYVGKTREFLVREEQKGSVSKEKIQLAWQNMYAAEGSDWFWWYGDDFCTDCDEEFDSIFRMHLGNVYKTLGYDIPEYLKESVLYIKEVQVTQPPIAFINPVIDGMNTDFYEWADAGYHDVKRHGGTLYKGESYFSRIYFGFNLTNFFIRMDPILNGKGFNGDDLKVELNILYPKEYQISFSLAANGENTKQFSIYTTTDGVNFTKIKDYNTIKIKNIVELSIPFKALGFKPNENMHFFMQIRKNNNIQIDRYPRRGYIACTIPDENFELDKWNA
jgi:alpha-amylase/alpha-mannosidase (GH57 family)